MSDIASAAAGATVGFFFPEPSTVVAVSAAAAGVAKPVGVGLVNIADGLYKLRGKSPERPEITKQVDKKMKRIQTKRDIGKELDDLRAELKKKG